MNAALAAVSSSGEFGHLDGAVMVSVTLSERNLRSLLSQWEEKEHAFLARRTEGDLLLSIRVEPDPVHYNGREPGPLASEENPFPPRDINEP